VTFLTPGSNQGGQSGLYKTGVRVHFSIEPNALGFGKLHSDPCFTLGSGNHTLTPFHLWISIQQRKWNRLADRPQRAGVHRWRKDTWRCAGACNSKRNDT
jgi:hypothetical protein